MSQENVEVISRAIDAWNRRDLDGFLAERIPTWNGIRSWPQVLKDRGACIAALTKRDSSGPNSWPCLTSFPITIQKRPRRRYLCAGPCADSGRAHSGVPVDTP